MSAFRNGFAVTLAAALVAASLAAAPAEAAKKVTKIKKAPAPQSQGMTQEEYDSITQM